jgi:cytochrome P450
MAEHPLLAELQNENSRHDPYPIYAAMRKEPIPLHVRPGLVIGDYFTCAQALRDPILGAGRKPREGDAAGRDRLRPPTFLSMDPPDHTRLRGLVSRAFTPRVVSDFAPRIEKVVEEFLAKAIAKPEFDLVSSLSYPLPLKIISEILGVPFEDTPKLERWSKAFTIVLDPLVTLRQAEPSQLSAIKASVEEFGAYFETLIADRRRAPREDLVTRLVQIEERGDTLTEWEVVTTCSLLLVAGHDTTANLTSNAVLALLRHPGVLDALRNEPSLVDAVVEETLRWDPPVQITARVVREQTRIAGFDLPAEAVVLILLAAANRDPAYFDDPDTFDIARAKVAHHAFGGGIHFCLGAPLARLETAIALRVFTEMVKNPRLVDVEYRSHVNVRGPQRLMLRHSA